MTTPELIERLDAEYASIKSAETTPETCAAIESFCNELYEHWQELRRGYLLGHAAENAPTVAWVIAPNVITRSQVVAKGYPAADKLIPRPKVTP
jgi:hypothetical protein